MKTIKKCCALLLAITCLLLCAAEASADAQTFNDYDTIVSAYRDAVQAETQEDALKLLKKLCDYYEKPGRSEALEKYEGGTAYVFYTYAKGVIAFSNQSYADARACFELLQGIQVETGLNDVPPLPDTTYYYQFSLAMDDFQAGEYENAFSALETARTAPGASAIACLTAKGEFAAGLKQKAQELCASGDHATAQQYYQLLIDNNIADGKALLNACREHSQTAALGITAAEATGTDAIALAWTGSAKAYRVCWSADLTGRTQVHAQIVEGNSLTLTSLFPGTDYRITIEQAAPGSAPGSVQPKPETEGVVETTVRTLSAPKYPSKSVQFVRSSVVGVHRDALRLKAPLEIVELLPASYHLESSEDIFTESSLQSFELCCLVTYRNQSGEEIAVPVTFLLRAPTSGVYAAEETKPLYAGSHVFDFLFDDLLEMAEEANGSLEKGEYAWEIYFDGLLFCKGTFTIKDKAS